MRGSVIRLHIKGMATEPVQMKMKLFFEDILWYTTINMRKKEGKKC